MHKIITRYWFRHLLVLAALIVLVNLGLWQLRRLEQRQALNEMTLAALNEPPVTLTGQAIEPEALHLRRVSVTGKFDNEESIILRSRNFRACFLKTAEVFCETFLSEFAPVMNLTTVKIGFRNLCGLVYTI